MPFSHLIYLKDACIYFVIPCLITAGDKERGVNTRQSQSGRSLPSKRSTSASISTLSKGSGTDKRTSGKHACIYVLFI